MEAGTQEHGPDVHIPPIGSADEVAFVNFDGNKSDITVTMMLLLTGKDES